MRGVHAVRHASAAVRGAAGDEEGVGALDPGGQRAAESAVDVALRRARLAELPVATVDVLRTVAERLTDLDLQSADAGVGQAAVEAIAATGVELEAEQTDVAAGSPGLFERIARYRRGVDP